MITHYNALNFKEDVGKLIDKINMIYDFIYGVPRGGIPLAVALSQGFDIPLADDLSSSFNYLVVDDVIDSGKTRLKYIHYDFACLHIKQNAPSMEETAFTTFIANQDRIEDWIEYFWEGDEQPAEDAIIRLICCQSGPGRKPGWRWKLRRQIRGQDRPMVLSDYSTTWRSTMSGWAFAGSSVSGKSSAYVVNRREDSR